MSWHDLVVPHSAIKLKIRHLGRDLKHNLCFRPLNCIGLTMRLINEWNSKVSVHLYIQMSTVNSWDTKFSVCTKRTVHIAFTIGAPWLCDFIHIDLNI